MCCYELNWNRMINWDSIRIQSYFNSNYSVSDPTPTFSPVHVVRFNQTENRPFYLKNLFFTLHIKLQEIPLHNMGPTQVQIIGLKHVTIYTLNIYNMPLYSFNHGVIYSFVSTPRTCAAWSVFGIYALKSVFTFIQHSDHIRSNKSRLVYSLLVYKYKFRQINKIKKFWSVIRHDISVIKTLKAIKKCEKKFYEMCPSFIISFSSLHF